MTVCKGCLLDLPDWMKHIKREDGTYQCAFLRKDKDAQKLFGKQKEASK